MAAANWLLSRPVQDMLDKLAELLLANALPAERKFAEVKQWEGSKLSHIASASRDAIATRYMRWRDGMCDALEYRNTHGGADQHTGTRVATAYVGAACRCSVVSE